MAEAGNLKVDQIGNIATNYGPLQPVLPSQASPLTPTACGPDFTRNVYFNGCRLVKNHTCLVIPPPPNTLNYTYITGGVGDPGAGNFRPNLLSYTTIFLSLSTTDADGDNVTSLLSAMASATTITFFKTSDPSITSTVTINSSSNNGTYWTFTCTIVSSVGTPSVGNNITFTYS